MVKLFTFSALDTEQRINKIEAKTSTMVNSQTNDYITLTILKQGTSCTTNKLDNPGAYDDFESGQTDTFSGSILGQCRDKLLQSSSDGLKITLKTRGNNGWMMEWVKIYADDGTMWICKNSNNKWLAISGNNNYYPEYSINCQGKYCFILRDLNLEG